MGFLESTTNFTDAGLQVSALPAMNFGFAIDDLTHTLSRRTFGSAEAGLHVQLRSVRNMRLLGDRASNTLRGGAGDDILRGGASNDGLNGLGGRDRMYGDQGDDRLWGGTGNDMLTGGRGNDWLNGASGNDQLVGSMGADQLVGGTGDDRLTSGGGQDQIIGGAGRDQFVLNQRWGSAKQSAATVITDFTNGQDTFWLSRGLTLDALKITQGTGNWADSTIIQHQVTGHYLVILKSVSCGSIDAIDFGITNTPIDTSSNLDSQSNLDTQSNSGAQSNSGTQSTSGSQTIPALVSVNSSTIKFAAGDGEEAIAATGAAHIKIGTQTLYIGTQQVTSINQNPIIASFDSSNPSNTWMKTNYEITGADGRGYGLFWSGTHLYAVFSVDGTQGLPEEDFRRVSGGASQSWLRSYGQGGGPKVAVLARLNLATGDMTEAVYLSSILSNGNSNSLAVTNLSVNAAGNLVMSADSYYAPRRPDGQAMMQTSSDGSPFAYTLEITPDLKTVVHTAATGWA